MKKLLLVLAIMSLLMCALVICVSAETPALYIEFQVKLAGNSDYTTAYVENTEAGNPRVNLTLDFYSDVEFTQTIDKSQITVLDFSNAVHSNPNKDYVDRFTTADPSLFPLCEEVKWFSRVFTKTPSTTFNNWTQLKRFDFGCITEIDYNFLSNSGIEEVVLPSSVTKLHGSVFYNCTSLKSVTIEGGLTSVAGSMFQNCTALETVDLGSTTVIGDSMFRGCTSLKTIYNANSPRQEGAVFIPEGVAKINQFAFENCKSIKYLSLPSTFNYAGQNIFYGCSALEFIDFNGNTNDINFYNCSHFQNCTSLKAVSLPDNVTVLNNRILSNCTNLQAVYLPASLEQMNTNGNGQGPFCGSGKMYFVQDAFEVRDENGYFLGDSFVMPEKPEMYFMPSTLSKAGGNVSSGTWFRECAGLNNIIVMPEAFTESTVVQMFRGTASASQRKTVVYLGAMTNYAWSEMNKYIDFVFANPANTDISTLTFTSFYNRNNENCYFYFCSTGYKYTMAKSSVDEVAATLEENSYCHVKELSKTTEATCTLPAMTANFCFCGQFIPETETVLEPALGHNYTGNVTYTFTSVTEKGQKCTACVNNCGIDELSDIAPVYTALGVSINEFSTSPYSFSSGYEINRESLELYEKEMGVSLKFGFAFNSADTFTDGDVTLDSFKLKTTVLNQTADIKFDRHDFIMSYATDEHLAKDVVIAAFIIETKGENKEVSFINRNSDTTVGVNGFDVTSYQKELEKIQVTE